MKAFIFAAIAAVSVAAIKLPAVPDTVLAGAFPADFDFGVSTSSYQVEGGWLEGGKGFSVWDVYSHIPGQIANGDTGDVANDMYHLYPSDIKIMAAQGVRNYRFSIAWNRIMPTGVAPINQEGVDYYNDLINQLIANGIEPHVTLYHSEMPSALTLYPHKPLPFLDLENFPTWFSNYADAAFELFGDRVKHWFTFNEPFCFSVYGVYGYEVLRLYLTFLTFLVLQFGSFANVCRILTPLRTLPSSHTPLRSIFTARSTCPSSRAPSVRLFSYGNQKFSSLVSS